MDVIDENGNVIPKSREESKRVLAGVLGILFGALGIHKFVLGYTNERIIILAITLVTCGIGAAVTGIIGLVEGIVYLTKTDEEFIYIYLINKKAWF